MQIPQKRSDRSMINIKFGTDGWRAIIAQDYTTDNVRRVTAGVAKWMLDHGYSKVVVGHDTRFGGALFADTATRVFGAFGLKVHLAKGFVSTPMVSLGVVKTKSDLGVVITASHNPPAYNGYKVKSSYGGPALLKNIDEIEGLIPNTYSERLPGLNEMFETGLLNYVDLEGIYADHVKRSFDFAAIKKGGFTLAYDAMYGAGQSIVKNLLPHSVFIHCEENPSFHGRTPEPLADNLTELAEIIKKDSSVTVGLATDGDADRLAMFDENGAFVDAHHLILLLLLYLVKYKNQYGKVVVSFSISDKIHQMAKIFGLDVETTKIGFKHIAEVMASEDVLIGGEESGGIAVKGHIPERDGVWIGLMVLEFMARTGKSLENLIEEVNDLVGPFVYKREDLPLEPEQKQAIIAACQDNSYDSFGSFPVQSLQTTDGFKYSLGDEEWVMIRASSTEPVLRLYAQASTKAKVDSILEAVKDTILQYEL